MASKNFCIRVTHVKDNEENIVKILENIGENYIIVKCLVVKHLRRADNPHSHIVLDLSDPVKQHNLRYYFTKLLEPRSYSLKRSDDSLKRYSYCFHEKATTENISYKLNVTQDDLVLYMQMCEQIQSAMPDKGSKRKLVDDIVKEYKRLYFVDQEHCETDGTGGSMLRWDYQKVFKRVMRLVLNTYSDWVPNGFQMERYVMTVIRELYQTDFGDFYFKYHFGKKIMYMSAE